MSQPPRTALAPLPLQRHQLRHGLPGTRRHLAEGALTVGFIGGSITDGRGENRWPDPVMSWLLDTFPNVCFRMENAGIGATGSAYGALRARRHLIERGCRLVFIEYAVNDNGQPADQRARSREGLIRQLLAAGIEVVIVYTFCEPMGEAMLAGRVPDSIADFEALADHYGLSSVWMALQALEEVRAGRLRWHHWLPDGIHPDARGSLSYGEAVNDYLRRELVEAPNETPQPLGDELPQPLHAGAWQHVRELPYDRLELAGPWLADGGFSSLFSDHLLRCPAPGATLAGTFHGTGIAIVFDFGTRSGEFRWRLDGGEWRQEQRERPTWMGARGWPRISLLAEGLPAGEHRLELETTHGGPGAGSDCVIIHIGILTD